VPRIHAKELTRSVTGKAELPNLYLE
jgi:hypothetical protein